ncbi:MAG: class I SAM-dependent methyltransferase [Gammaproteobacteria bacterium]|nr:class I SAM-dependent methyltransferase [Gammaproteobacteria bacterium]MCP5137084.1 class I SAM-dependent methyltransferase [Gammaproteobacteria bacterium]
MALSSLPRKIARVLRRDGFFGTLQVIAKNLVHELHKHTPTGRAARNRVDPFDAKYGTDTWGQVEAGELNVDSEFYDLATRYEASWSGPFHRAMSSLALSFAELTFIDLGSGKGRTLLMASDYPFKRIVGVEFSQALCDIARNNVEIYRGEAQKTDAFEVVCDDATRFPLPDGPLLIYMYHPFGDQVMRRVIENIERSAAENPRPIRIVYMNPVHQGGYRDSKVLREVAEDPHFKVYQYVG